MDNFSKVVNPGCGMCGQVYCVIKWENGKLSITGVEGPLTNGNAKGGCGQIQDHVISSCSTLTNGWSVDTISRFIAIWNEWHLNDMVAGSPNQEKYMRENPLDEFSSRQDHYGFTCARLKDAGLNPDKEYIHNGKPYSYGSAWLKKDVPDDVLTFLAGIPDTTHKPAWC